MSSCEHVQRGDEAVQVLPQKPHDAHYVTCPCCGQWGWRSDQEPMPCPECGVEAVRVVA